MSTAQQYRKTRPRRPAPATTQVIDLRDDPPTERQIAYATVDLQLTIPAGANKYEVSKLIKREVARRGREALRRRHYERYTLLVHPRYGDCEIDRIGVKTLKVTLAPLDGGRKIVIDAMYLDECELVNV